MRNARSNARATSRCPTKRTLPCFENLTRTGNPLLAPHWSSTALLLLSRSLAEQRDRDGVTMAQVLTGALAAAGRRHRRRDDVLDRVVGAHPAVVARGPPAIGEPVLGQRGLPVLPEEVLVQPRRDVVPRQDLVLGAVAGDVPVRVETLGRHRVHPAVDAGSARSTPGTSRRRATPARSPDRSCGRHATRALRRTSRSGRATSPSPACA